MMRRVFLIWALFIIPVVSAQANIQADYQIIDSKILADLKFDTAGSLEIKMPYDAEALEVNADYKLEGSILRVSSAQNLEIKYITSAYIDKSRHKYFFTLKNPFAEKADVLVYLPEGVVLAEDGILFPGSPEKSTDGRRIILIWKDFSEEQILVEYSFVKDNGQYYLIIATLLAAFIILVLYYKRKLKGEIRKARGAKRGKGAKQDKEEELTRNLFEDEKRIVQCLLNKKNNEAWTKEIIKELGISKVKLSRKLRSLEAKEIIKKIPYGNENRVRLVSK